MLAAWRRARSRASEDVFVRGLRLAAQADFRRLRLAGRARRDLRDAAEHTPRLLGRAPQAAQRDEPTRCCAVGRQSRPREAALPRLALEQAQSRRAEIQSEDLTPSVGDTLLRGDFAPPNGSRTRVSRVRSRSRIRTPRRESQQNRRSRAPSEGVNRLALRYAGLDRPRVDRLPREDPDPGGCRWLVSDVQC